MDDGSLKAFKMYNSSTMPCKIAKTTAGESTLKETPPPLPRLRAILCKSRVRGWQRDSGGPTLASIAITLDVTYTAA